MKFSIKDFFSKCEQIRRKLRTDLVTFDEATLNPIHDVTVIPYLKKIQKNINQIIGFLNSAGISAFSPKISNFCNIKKKRYRLNFNT